MRSIIEGNPIDAIVSTLFIGGVFGLLYVSLWIFSRTNHVKQIDKYREMGSRNKKTVQVVLL